VCEVEIRYGPFGTFNYVRYAEDGTPIIFLNPLTDSLVGDLVRIYLKRPISKNVSLAHELGHVFMNKFAVGAVRREVKKAFGDIDKKYCPDFYGSRNRKAKAQYFTRYGQEHPIEEFADVFAYLVTHDNRAPAVDSRALAKKFAVVQKMVSKAV
jgi:hypothetical protein